MASIYVGTYAKYNAGNLFGQWLDPSDYEDKETFIEACKELHADEEDPELMFQDFEEIPDGMISEGHVSEDLWEWLDLDSDDQQLLEVYRSSVSDGSIDQARDAYCGKYNSPEDWAEEHLTDSGDLNEVPEHLRGYIDFASWARDAELGGSHMFLRHGGDCWVFHNN